MLYIRTNEWTRRIAAKQKPMKRNSYHRFYNLRYSTVWGRIQNWSARQALTIFNPPRFKPVKRACFFWPQPDLDKILWIPYGRMVVAHGGNTEYSQFWVLFKGNASVHVKRFLNINRFNPDVRRKRYADSITKIRVWSLKYLVWSSKWRIRK